MYTVHILRRGSYPAQVRAIVASQAGGCTRAELPRENARKARAAASRLHGGLPMDWTVLRYVGAWETREAAEAIAAYENGAP